MELDGALAGATNLVDRTGNLRVADIGGVGGIVKDEGVVLQGVVHPLAQLGFGDDGTCGVVGVAQVDHVDGTTLGQLGHKTVLGRGGQVAHIGPASVAESATATYHHVGVDIDGVDGIGDANEVVPVEQLLEVTRIALCTIVDKDLVDIEVDATRQEVVLEDGFTEEVVTLLRTIAAKTLDGAHLVGGLVHGLDHSGCQGLRDVADTQGDDVGLGVHHLEGIDLLSNVGEQVVVLQVQEMNVY